MIQDLLNFSQRNKKFPADDERRLDFRVNGELSKHSENDIFSFLSELKGKWKYETKKFNGKTCVNLQISEIVAINRPVTAFWNKNNSKDSAESIVLSSSLSRLFHRNKKA